MPASDYRPDVNAVGALIYARTTDQYDKPQGTFTEDTTPTAVQVEGLIDAALPIIAVQIGDTIDEQWWPAALRLVALHVAISVERGYYQHAINQDQSVYTALKAEHDQLLEALKNAHPDRKVGQAGWGSVTMHSGYAFPRDDVSGFGIDGL